MSVDASAVARVLGISVEFVDLRGDRALFLPQRIAVIAQGATASTYSLTKRRVRSAAEGGGIYGFGSPIHLILRELLPENGDGVGTIPVTVYPLEDVYDTGVPAEGTITPAGSQTKKGSYRVRIGGVLSQAFIVDASDTVAERCAAITAAINAVLHMPVVAADNTTAVGLTAKWAGATGNGISIEVPDGDNAQVFGTLYGGTFTVAAMADGLTDPTVDDALDQVGNVWETMVVNAIGDDTSLDTIQDFGEGRWGELVRRPLVSFSGSIGTSANTLSTLGDTRKDDRVNALLTAPGSVNLPCVVAARQVARIARIANNNPPTDYGAQRATGLIAGTDAEQWDYITRDSLVKSGVSTTEGVDGVITIGDVVTFYHPDGEEPPAYRYVVDIVRLQNCIYNFDLKFGSSEWAAAPLIPNDQATVNPNAKKPSSAIAEAAAILDGLGDEAIISDPDTAKKNTTATISSSNPKRLDMVVPIQLSGNTNVKSVDLKFGFYFGNAA